MDGCRVFTIRNEQFPFLFCYHFSTRLAGLYKGSRDFHSRCTCSDPLLRPAWRPASAAIQVRDGILFSCDFAFSVQCGCTDRCPFLSCQVARMFLLYAIVTKACADPRVAPAILTGMGAAVIFEAGCTIWQRFGMGLTQTTGTFIHQNSLGLVSHFVVFPYFALLLAKRGGWMVPMVVLSGAIIEVLTTSRGTLAFAGFGYAAVFILSAMRRWTLRKAVVLSMGVLAVAILVPLAISSFEQRFSEGLPGDEYGGYDERTAYKVAAAMMLSDHPLGVGGNTFLCRTSTDTMALQVSRRCSLAGPATFIIFTG